MRERGRRVALDARAGDRVKAAPVSRPVDPTEDPIQRANRILDEVIGRAVRIELDHRLACLMAQRANEARAAQAAATEEGAAA